MTLRQPAVKTIKASEARQQWSALINQVFRDKTRVVVEKSGIPVAAIISAEDLKSLEWLEQERQQDFSVLEDIGKAFKDIPATELEQEVKKALASVRREKRKSQAHPAATA